MFDELWNTTSWFTQFWSTYNFSVALEVCEKLCCYLRNATRMSSHCMLQLFPWTGTRESNHLPQMILMCFIVKGFCFWWVWQKSCGCLFTLCKALWEISLLHLEDTICPWISLLEIGGMLCLLLKSGRDRTPHRPASHSEPAPTSPPPTGCPVITQLWMNLKWVNIWFHFDNQFWRK